MEEITVCNVGTMQTLAYKRRAVQPLLLNMNLHLSIVGHRPGLCVLVVMTASVEHWL